MNCCRCEKTFSLGEEVGFTTGFRGYLCYDCTKEFHEKLHIEYVDYTEDLKLPDNFKYCPKCENLILLWERYCGKCYRAEGDVNLSSLVNVINALANTEEEQEASK